MWTIVTNQRFLIWKKIYIHAVQSPHMSTSSLGIARFNGNSMATKSENHGNKRDMFHDFHGNKGAKK